METRAFIYTKDLLEKSLDELVGGSMGIELVDSESTSINIPKLIEVYKYCVMNKLELTYYINDSYYEIIKIEECKKCGNKYISYNVIGIEYFICPNCGEERGEIYE